MVNIEKARQINGWMEISDLEWLAEQASKHELILELGSLLGRSTRAICDNTSGKVLVVDNWNTPAISNDATYEAFKVNMKDHIDSGKLEIYKGNIIDAFTYFINKIYLFDFIFIDSDHNYEPAKSDIINSQKILTPGGLLSGHDYNWEGVKKAVDELLPNRKLHNFIWYMEVK